MKHVKNGKLKIRNQLAIHAFNRGMAVEPDRKKYNRKAKHKKGWE